MKRFALLALLLACPAYADGGARLREYGAATTIDFGLYTSSGAVSTGETPATATLYCDEGTGAASTNNFAELGNGEYSLALTATEMQCARLVVAIAGSAETTLVSINTYGNSSAQVPVYPANVTEYGGSAGTFASGIPAVNTTQLNGTAQTARDIGASVLLSSGTGTGQISLSSGNVTVGTVAAGAIADTSFDTTTGPLKALGIIRQGTPQAYTSADPSVTLDSSAPFATSDLIGNTIWVCGTTNAYCESETITAYDSSTKKATIDAAFNTAPTGTLTYYIFGTPPQSTSGEQAIADKTLATVVETNNSVSLKCAIATMLAQTVGTLSVSGSVPTESVTYKDPSGTTTRVTGTITSSSGGRSSMSLTCP